MENPGIDPGTSRMLSERSTIWANPPLLFIGVFWRSELERNVAHHPRTQFQVTQM